MKPKTKKRKLLKSKIREQRRIKNRKDEREIFKEQLKTKEKGFTIRGKTPKNTEDYFNKTVDTADNNGTIQGQSGETNT